MMLKNADLLLEDGFEFNLQRINELTDPPRFAGLRRPGKQGSLPAAFIVFLMMDDEDVGIISLDYAGHLRSIYFSIKIKLS